MNPGLSEFLCHVLVLVSSIRLESSARCSDGTGLLDQPWAHILCAPTFELTGRLPNLWSCGWGRGIPWQDWDAMSPMGLEAGQTPRPGMSLVGCRMVPLTSVLLSLGD